MKSFENLNLSPQILQALKSKGYTQPTAIQEQAIPVILEGKDIFGSADTGTGKTAAFALPLLELMSKNTDSRYKEVRTLILAPTRELAIQISDNFREYGKHLNLKYALVYGGISQHGQTSTLRRGVDVIIATPGRLLDLMDQGYINLNTLNHLVFDEADRMLEMGFLPDIKRIVAKTPSNRQTLFFSATVPTEIKKLAATLLRNPVTIEVKATIDTKINVKQSVYFVDKSYKKDLLLEIINSQEIAQAIVFTKTKHTADKLAKALFGLGISAEAIHGDKSQGKRQRTLANFKNKRIAILVATDLASRGIDVKELPYVINYDLPQEVETYTHRIGRTARAGSYGVALSFCSHEEKHYFRAIQRIFGTSISIEQHAYINQAPKPSAPRERSDNYNDSPNGGYPRRRSNGQSSSPHSSSNNQRNHAKRPRTRRRFEREPRYEESSNTSLPEQKK